MSDGNEKEATTLSLVDDGIDPAWRGNVEFYELLFGSWVSYIFLVLQWDLLLLLSGSDSKPLSEWRYLMIHLFGASAFLINHYFQFSPYYGAAPTGLMYLYTYLFTLVWYTLLVRQFPLASLPWKIVAVIALFPYSIVFAAAEFLARIAVTCWLWSDFWLMLMTYLGFAGIIAWRGCRRGQIAKADKCSTKMLAETTQL